MTAISHTDARENLASIMNKVRDHDAPIIITRYVCGQRNATQRSGVTALDFLLQREP